MNDPKLLSVRRELAILQARQVELLQRLDTAESGESWRKVRDLAVRADEAGARGDAVALRESITDLLEVVESGEKEEATWRSVIEGMRDKARLIEAEGKREKVLEAFMPGPEVLGIVGWVFDLGLQALREKWPIEDYSTRVQKVLAERYPD